MKKLRMVSLALLASLPGFGDPVQPGDENSSSECSMFRLAEPTTPVRLKGVDMWFNAGSPLEEAGGIVPIFLVTTDNTRLGPVISFIDMQGEGFLVDSLPVVNAILKKWSPTAGRYTDVELVKAVLPFVYKQIVAEGESTGLVLTATTRSMLLGLLEQRLPRDRFEILKNRLVVPKITVEAEVWNANWIEIDRLGGAERVVAHGTMHPLSIRRVVREVLLDAGEIPPELMNVRTLGAAVLQQKRG